MNESIKLAKISKINGDQDIIHVLHVDDETDFLTVAKQILELNPRFQVESATSVEEALKKLETNMFDVVVSDYQMPNKDGLTFLKLLRDKKTDIPFILFTGKGREEVAIKALNLGADYYVNKIGSIETVYGELGHYIRQLYSKRKSIKRLKEAEEKYLLQSEEKYQKLFDEAMDAIFLADAQTGIIIDCNRAATELIGVPKSELIGEHQSILHPSGALEDCFTECFKKQCTETSLPIMETRVVTKKGKIKDVTVKVSSFELGNDRIVQGTFRDVTDLKKTEKELQDSERTHRALLNSMKDTAWVINSDAKIIDVNNAAVNVLGYSRDEFLSMRIKDIDSNLDPAVIKSLVDNMPRDKLQVFSTEHTTKSGKKIPVEICSSLVDYKGKQVILSIARDITERKKAEACSEKLMDDLRVINEKLEVVGNLTRHDARNKLAVITNNVFLLKHMLAGNQNALDHLASVELALEHIEELFSFAKNYELLGIQKLDDINVTQCIQEATAILDLRGIQLVNNCNCLCLRADLLLRQLFYNLIDNSLRHGKSVTCIKICYELNKDNLKLIYEDDGVGISEADKANMFKKGYGKGTGYGLYLIKRLCATYGWEIKEIGTPGNGVRFVIDIPEDKYKFNKTTKQECPFSFS